MDKTELFIDMSGKATEIQALWKPDIGDWFLHDYRNTTGAGKDLEKQIWGDGKDKWEEVQCLTYKPSSTKEYVTVSSESGVRTMSMSDFIKHRCVWLPGQDRLQEL